MSAMRFLNLVMQMQTCAAVKLLVSTTRGEHRAALLRQIAMMLMPVALKEVRYTNLLMRNLKMYLKTRIE